ncbi:MAG: lamin tail domain-containing protein [Candidatus Marinimicrobia bacterium]|nr:lamin tail domain-containing protein [Candidatus Neomarinimicrobiota bacterium]
MLLLTFLSLVLNPLEITISEVMFDLAGTDSPNEFVEIHNFSDSTIDISGWKIADLMSEDNIVGDDLQIPPNCYAVIFEGDYDGVLYQDIIPEEAYILYVDGLTIGNNLNNSADSLFLISNLGDTISYMGWNSGNPDGFSLEKIVLDFPNIEINWQTSIDSLGTPGFSNSIAGFATDVGIDSVWNDPHFPSPNEAVTVFVSITNVGLLDVITNLSVNSEFLSSVNLTSLENCIVEIPNNQFDSGNHDFQFIIQSQDDYNSDNNSLIHTIKVEYNYHDLLINEIMYDPISGNSEWVEIVNVSNEEINLFGWMISDNDNYETGILESVKISPYNFIVISKDSLFESSIFQEDFPTLNNSGDNVYLFDHTGKMIDHIYYEPSWGGGDGFSLERITHFLDSNNSENWGTSVAIEGSTPNEQNSLFVETIQVSGSLTLSPNPFSPDGDGFEDELIIAYHLPFTTAVMKADIYDVRGRKIISLKEGERVSMEGILRWDGKMTTGEKCRVGQYLLVIEAVGSYSSEMWKTVERIILAKKLN